jgi:hypothetical protein
VHHGRARCALVQVEKSGQQRVNIRPYEGNRLAILAGQRLLHARSTGDAQARVQPAMLYLDAPDAALLWVTAPRSGRKSCSEGAAISAPSHLVAGID